MSITEIWRNEAEPIFTSIYQHPFVVGIRQGQLSKEALLYYVAQDRAYLQTFLKVYGLALAQATDEIDRLFLAKQIGFLAELESEAHNNFCEVAGVTPAEIPEFPLAPTTLSYMNHMLVTAYRGNLAETYAALLPCPWTYEWIAKRIQTEEEISPQHPFYRWIQFYTGETIPALTQFLRDRVDQLALYTIEAERKRMKDAFLLSCKWEYSFWEMAYQKETWIV